MERVCKISSPSFLIILELTFKNKLPCASEAAFVLIRTHQRINPILYFRKGRTREKKEQHKEGAQDLGKEEGRGSK